MKPKSDFARHCGLNVLLLVLCCVATHSGRAAQLIDDFEYSLPIQVISSPLTNHGWTSLTGGGRDLVSVPGTDTPNPTRFALAQGGSGRIARVASLNGQTEPGFVAELDILIGGIVEFGNAALTLAAGSPSAPQDAISFGVINPGPITNEASAFFLQTPTRVYAVPAFPLGGWVRFRLLVNPKAYEGDGAGWLQLGTGLTGGNWRPIKGLEGVQLGFKNPGAIPPGNWGTIVLDLPRFVGADNIAVGDEVLVKLRALEVTQGTQDLHNRVPLVAGKKTFVRAMVEAPAGESGGFVMAARLRGFRDGQELPGSPLPRFLTGVLTEREPYPVPASGQGIATRDSFYDSVNFLLPSTWATNNLELQLDSDVVIECDAPNDGACGAQVSFEEVPPVEVRIIPVRVEGANPPVSLTANDMLEVMRSIAATYPATVFEFSIGSTIALNLDRESEQSLSPLLDRLETARTSDGNVREIYYGLIPRAPTPGLYGLGRTGGNVAAGMVNHPQNDYPSRIFEHELGHVLGRPHSVDHTQGQTETGSSQGYCGEVAAADAEKFPFFFSLPPTRATLGPMNTGESNLVYGLNALHIEAAQSGTTIEPVLKPSEHFELMSYCDNYSRTEPWPSIHTCSQLKTAIQGRFGALPAALAFPLAAAAEDYVLVRGAINAMTLAAHMEPAIRLSRTSPPNTTPGPFRCRVLDGFGLLLSETPFATQRDSNGKVEESFFILVPWGPTARDVEIVKDGQVLASLRGSLNAPSVQLISPNGGQVLDMDPVVVSWAGVDADEDDLTYQLQYSQDAGETWRTIATDLRGTSYSIANADLPASVSGLFRVIASDGVNNAIDMSDTAFQVPNHAPQPLLFAPTAGATLFADGLIRFDGLALDPDQGSNAGLSLEWHSDQQGLLGTGRHLEKNATQFAPGEHLITLTARDSGGLVSTASITITVIPFTRPWLLAAINSTNQMLNLQVNGTAGTRLIVETSSNLLQWTTWRTLTQTNRTQLMTEAPEPGSQPRFFRARTEVLPITVIQQPASVAGLNGNWLTLEVNALGSRLAYQWFFNGVALTNSTNATLVLENASPAQTGSYFVVVSNFSGVVTSAVSFVTVVGAVMEQIHAFGTNSLDGINGWGPLTFGSDGWLYGCARNGAIAGGGVAFKLRPDGRDYTVLRRFQSATDGATPLGGIIEGSDGRLYGTTSLGGTNNAGTVFALNKDGSGFTVLRHFLSTGDCRNPQAELLEGSDGALYGTAYNGGGFGRGGIFKLNKDGSGYAIINGLNFGGTEAPSQPLGGLIEALDGLLYGTTELGGLSNKGTIFRMAKDGSSNAVLKSLGLVAGGAANPSGTLLQARDGFLYGTTYSGGPSNVGAVVKLSPDGSFFSVIFGFGTNSFGGLEPRAGLTEAPNGQLLGTTRIGGGTVNEGVIYRLNRNGSGYENLRSFGSGNNPGGRARSPLLGAPGGVFFGMTFGGGVNDRGVIFRYFLPELIP